MSRNRSDADLQAIKTELATDPTGIGYAPHTDENDESNAKALNVDRDAVTVSVASRDAGEVWAAITAEDYASLSPLQASQLNARLACGNVALQRGSETKKFLRDLFGGGSDTIKNLRGLWDRRSSRANQMHEEGLLSVGGRITESDVADARKV